MPNAPVTLHRKYVKRLRANKREDLFYRCERGQECRGRHELNIAEQEFTEDGTHSFSWPKGGKQTPQRSQRVAVVRVLEGREHSGWTAASEARRWAARPATLRSPDSRFSSPHAESQARRAQAGQRLGPQELLSWFP